MVQNLLLISLKLQLLSVAPVVVCVDDLVLWVENAFKLKILHIFHTVLCIIVVEDLFCIRQLFCIQFLV